MGSPVIDKPLYPDPGRYRVTLATLRADAGFNDHRNRLLDHLDEFTEFVRLVVPVCAMWVAGSFLTGKELPNDIDVVLVVDEEHLHRLAENWQKRLVTAEGLHALANAEGLKIDGYVLGWRARPATGPEGPEDESYLLSRGYWDDFWGRQRTVPKNEAPTRACALPRRGYVEVILDDYS